MALWTPERNQWPKKKADALFLATQHVYCELLGTNEIFQVPFDKARFVSYEAASDVVLLTAPQVSFLSVGRPHHPPLAVG
jgi:hypothetical protein